MEKSNYDTARHDTAQHAVSRLVQLFVLTFFLCIIYSPVHAIAFIEELIERGALHIAVRGRDEATILPFLSFVQKELAQNPAFTSLLLELMHVVFGGILFIA